MYGNVKKENAKLSYSFHQLGISFESFERPFMAFLKLAMYPKKVFRNKGLFLCFVEYADSNWS